MDTMSAYNKFVKVFWYAVMANNYTVPTRQMGDSIGRRLGEIESKIMQLFINEARS